MEKLHQRLASKLKTLRLKKGNMLNRNQSTINIHEKRLEEIEKILLRLNCFECHPVILCE